MPHPARISARKGKIAQAILILLACLATLGGAFLLTGLGPQNTSAATENPIQQRKELAELDKKSRDLWETFSNLMEFKKNIDANDLKILEEALRLRESFAREAGNPYDPVLEGIRKQWETLKAQEYREKSIQLEVQGNVARDKEDFPAAEKAFTEALALEKRIADECLLSQKKDIGRMAALNHLARTMQARPIWDASQKLETEGDALAQSNSWDKAAEKYNEAHSKEKLLRERYLGLLPLEYSRPGTLLKKADTARSSLAYAAITTQVKEAIRLANLGKLDESETLFAQALSNHADLVKSFPNSGYATKKTSEELQQTRDATLASPVLTSLREGIAALDQQIRAGQGDEAGTRALRLLQEANRLRQRFPDASAVAPETVTKLQYISFKSRDILLVQDRFLSTLKPLPGHPGMRMSYSEISQVLYAAIMENANPSATPGDTLPVDSVSYADTQEFCRRLSWLTGRTVRLPAETEFRAALGTVQPAELAKQAWSIENSNGRTQPVATTSANANGFNDLLGNVGEWLDSADPGQAPVIGGDCQTGIDQLTSVPLASVFKADKSRLRGFRVVAIEPAATAQ